MSLISLKSGVLGEIITVVPSPCNTLDIIHKPGKIADQSQWTLLQLLFPFDLHFRNGHVLMLEKETKTYENNC